MSRKNLKTIQNVNAEQEELWYRLGLASIQARPRADKMKREDIITIGREIALTQEGIKLADHLMQNLSDRGFAIPRKRLIENDRKRRR